MTVQSFTQVSTSWVSYLAKDQSWFVTGAIKFCVQAPTDICHMICGARSIRHYAIFGGGDKTVWICIKKEKHEGANSKDYWFPISTEFLRPFSTWHRWLGRKRAEKWSLCWISGCASICDLTCVMSSWTVPVILRPSAPERVTRSSFCLYDERGSTKD